MSSIFMLMITLLGILGFILYPVLRWKWSFAIGQFFGIFTIITILYVFGLFDVLLVGFYSVFFASILLTCVSVYLSRRELGEAFARLFSPSFVIFLFLLALFAYLSRSWMLSGWDEYSHWGIFAEAMYFKNRLPAVVSFVTVWPHYPPGITLFHYYVTRLIGYSDKALFFAQNIITLSAIVAILNGVTWKRSLLAVVAVIFGFWSIYFWGYRVNTIYMDGLLGVVFGASLIVYLGSEKKDWRVVLQLLPILFVFPLIKELGIIYALIIIGVILLDLVVLRLDRDSGFKAILRDKKNHLDWAKGVGLLAIPFVASYSWTLFLRFWHVDKFEHPISLGTLLNSFSISATDVQRDVVNAFMSAYQDATIGYIPFGSVGIIVCFMILVFIFTLINNGRGLYIQLFLLMGFLAYSAILFVYFIITNDPALLSYTRYIATYGLGWSYMIFGMFLIELRDKQDNRTQYSQNAVVVLFIFSSILILTPLVRIFTPPSAFGPRITINQQIERFLPYMDSDSHVWIIWQNSNGLQFHVVRYLIAPRSVNSTATRFTWSLGEPYFPDDTWTYRVSPQAWRNEIDRDKYDYVFIVKGDSQFWQNYGSLFCGADDQTETQLFVVEKDCFTRITP